MTKPCPSSSMDGIATERDVLEPLAVVGFSFKFPKDATSQHAFWNMLLEGRNASTKFPDNRLNVDAFYESGSGRLGSLSMQGGHFIEEDLGAFDAPFFSISPAEALGMDPQQQMMLETTYRALENAGIPIEEAQGSLTSVHVGCFTDDYSHVAFKDVDQISKYSATGTSATMLSNRISWFFDLKGMAVTVDSACSSSMVALDLACQGLWSHAASMALVGGSNLVYAAETNISMCEMNFLSPDSRCYSFDHRANGYARGEGVGMLVVKRLSDAIRDNDTIRAVIRSTYSNQDGHTPGLTQPSKDAQVALIRTTYARAGLNMYSTKFFEAHGTGTRIGDPTEAEAIGTAFQDQLIPGELLYIGAVKSNIGHLEGCAGIAGIIKTIMVLEKGVIPPNTNFERLNPEIDAKSMNLKFSAKCVPWPGNGLRRASVNSFGFGGTNSHAVLEDAYNFLRIRGIHGNHCTVPAPPLAGVFDDRGAAINIQSKQSNLTIPSPKLLVLSANDEKSLVRLTKSYARHFEQINVNDEAAYLNDLAYTLHSRRSSLRCKSFLVARSRNSLRLLDQNISKPIFSMLNPRIGYIFTGQGAQWYGMGRELLLFPVFRNSLLDAQEYLKDLGCEWSLLDELLESKESSKINILKLNQALCTAIQVALVDLLRSFGLFPVVVVGHSSGEIAAAYCAGAISCRAAWKLAYLRGSLASRLAEQSKSTGGMIAIGLSAASVQAYLDKVEIQPGHHGLNVSCISSPQNITVSGEQIYIDALEVLLQQDEIFTRKLPVMVAYHSAQMLEIAEEYLQQIGIIESEDRIIKGVYMISTVTGQPIDKTELLRGEYYVKNMLSQVKFSTALEFLCSQSKKAAQNKLEGSDGNLTIINDLLEIGPHSAMRGSVRDVLQSTNQLDEIRYNSALVRNRSALDTILQTLGRLYCKGYPIDIEFINRPLKSEHRPAVLPSLPEYPFDHSKKYWQESRISNALRFRRHGHHPLLGTPVSDWNPLEARWRHILRISEQSWMKDHNIRGQILYPAAGMAVMAIEAAKQMAENQRILAYEIKDLVIDSALNLSSNQDGIETDFYLRSNRNKSDNANPWSQFRLYFFQNGQWTESCRGFIKVVYGRTSGSSDSHEGLKEASRSTQLIHRNAVKACEKLKDKDLLYQALQEQGYQYGSLFKAVSRLRYTEVSQPADGQALGDVTVRQYQTEPSNVIHPTTFDAIFHIALGAYTRGGSRSISTVVPTRINKIWISNAGLSSAHPGTVEGYALVKETGQRFCQSSISVRNKQDDVLMLIDGLELTTIPSFHLVDKRLKQKDFCYNIDWKLDPDFLSQEQLVKYCQGLKCGPDEYYYSIGRARPVPGLAISALLLTLFPDTVIVVNEGSKKEQDMAKLVQAHHRFAATSDCKILTLKEAASCQGQPYFIFLLEIDRPFLRSLDAKSFVALQKIIQSTRRILWVTGGGGIAQNPDFGIITGLARVLHTEVIRLSIVILHLDISEHKSPAEVEYYYSPQKGIINVFEKTLLKSSSDGDEREYLEKDGMLYINRVIKAEEMNREVSSRVSGKTHRTQDLGKSPSFKLAIGTTGMLESLQWVEDEDVFLPLGDSDVEVKVSCFGVKALDSLVALGKVNTDMFGTDCAGIVTRVGASGTRIQVGQRVCVCYQSNYRSIVRAPECCVVAIPDRISFQAAAALPSEFVEAYYGLVEKAQLKKGETVLIHEADTRAGQVAVQLAFDIGAVIYATVSTGESLFLHEHYKIPFEQIFNCNNTSFVRSVIRLTENRGLDVIFNRLSGDGLMASLECIAPFGRFIDIRRSDIRGLENFPIPSLAQNMTYITVDLATILQQKPSLITNSLSHVMGFFEEGKAGKLRTSKRHGVSEIGKVFEMIQSEEKSEDFVIEVKDEEKISVILNTKPKYQFNEDATYVISGGFGGIGKGIARWMVTRGARNLLIISRFGPTTKDSHDFLAELKALGCRIEAPACDVTDESLLRSALDRVRDTMPPIKGCIQTAVILRDSVFETMTFSDWKISVGPKIEGSWNLHNLLPRGLDFFILLSSVSGIIGQGGQSNYSAANTYLDALAHYRIGKGEKATSIDLGAMLSFGLVAESSELRERFVKSWGMTEVTQEELYALLDYYCDPALPLYTQTQAQIVTGLPLLTELRDKGMEEPEWMTRLLFSALYQTASSAFPDVPNSVTPGRHHSVDFSKAFSTLSMSEVATLVTSQLAARLSKILSIPVEDFVLERPVIGYGLDSLAAVEVRNWLEKELKVDIAIFEILTGATFESLGMAAVRRSAYNTKF